MKGLLKVAAVAVVAAAFMTACKTSEANYRRAYERAVDGRDSLDAIENTIYGSHRRAMGSREVVIAGDTAEIFSQHVSVTEGGGGIRESLRPFNVVVGRFKQLFNATSMRNRLADAGYPDVFVVETAEPFYYIVLSSHSDAASAVKAMKEIPASFPMPLKAPLPFILQTGR